MTNRDGLTRYAVPVADDHGRYEIIGTPTPLWRLIDQADGAPLRVVEPIVGWGRWRWAVRLGAWDLFVDGELRPQEEAR